MCVHLVCVRNTARAVVVGRQKRRGCCIPRYLYGRPGSYVKLRRLAQRWCGGEADRRERKTDGEKKPQGSWDGYNMDLHTLESCKLLAHGRCTTFILYYIRRPGERRTRTTKRRRWNRRFEETFGRGVTRTSSLDLVIILYYNNNNYYYCNACSTQSLAVSCD